LPERGRERKDLQELVFGTRRKSGKVMIDALLPPSVVHRSSRIQLDP